MRRARLLVGGGSLGMFSSDVDDRLEYILTGESRLAE